MKAKENLTTVTSEALTQYQKKAAPYMQNPSLLDDLLDKIQGYIGEIIHRRFMGVEKLLREVPVLLRMAKAWNCHSYRDISYSNMLLIVAGLLYFLSPFDLVPDFFGIFGFVDDLAVLGMIASRLHKEIIKFQNWEKGALD